LNAKAQQEFYFDNQPTAKTKLFYTFAAMEHVLDNPAWNALVSGNEHLSFGNNQVKYFDKEVSPFAAFSEISPGNFRTLYEVLPDERLALIISPFEREIPAEWKVVATMRGLQMVYDTAKEQEEIGADLVTLTPAHVPEMVALTKLTNPGPFASRTIAFGHYHGIFDDGKLAAMAGQRLHVFNYAEISAVCTHPEHTGKGYARRLLLNQVNRIKAASEIPFLHVRYDNERAVKVYESLGFSTRREVYFYAIVKVK
jgi:ribosomal protein S18 acetylase RimI-like enzyme